MSIRVRYFASLKDRVGRAEDEIEFDEIKTVADVWLAANNQQAIPEHILAAVNMEYVTLEKAVNDGDEVAFFPPVTGG